jgi:hypothetical protein
MEVIGFAGLPFSRACSTAITRGCATTGVGNSSEWRRSAWLGYRGRDNLQLPEPPEQQGRRRTKAAVCVLNEGCGPFREQTAWPLILKLSLFG